ncbi:integrase [Methylovorus sp. MM2]|uniref:tyrosine-type recombinase/integrase n=1 Tax=Methylovorus sp. MM2 TaxID=1848038 RepID=UPI0007E0F771|nr:site-specific integrase [Methylovorus sp. MM2]OAM52942.1 integrase [Methylovorus sp. MM2]
MLVLREGFWYIDLTHPVTSKRVRKSTKTTDKKQAEALHAKIQNDMFMSQWEGDKPKECELTLQEAYDKAVKQRWSRSGTPDTVQYNFNRLVRFLDRATLIRDVTSPLIWEVIGELRDDSYPDSTINRSLAVLSTILKMARDDWEVLGKIPKVPKLDEGSGRLRWLQEGEEEVITDWFRAKGDNDMGDLIEVLLDTGCRVSEVLELRNNDVLLDDRMLVLRKTKKGSWDTQPLTNRALQIFARRTKMFDLPFGGLTRHAAIHRFHTMKKHCGFESDKELILHTMRHTTASRLVMKGTDLKRVQEFMRHADINTTLRYAKLSTKEKLKTAEVLEIVV